MWVQATCAVDSNACARVAPANVLALRVPAANLGPEFFVADGSHIDNIAAKAINVALGEGPEMATVFKIAKVARPLRSVHLNSQNGHEVKLSQGKNFIKLKGSNPRIDPRKGKSPRHARYLG